MTFKIIVEVPLLIQPLVSDFGIVVIWTASLRMLEYEEQPSCVTAYPRA
jgi:hypothetical protein